MTRPTSSARAAAAAGTVMTLLAILPAASAVAEDAEEPVDAIVVTGSRIGHPAGDVSSSTTIIDAGDIEATNRAGVLDLLRGVPGLQVTQPGGRGGVASVFIRGGEPNFTMVLVDGIRVNDPNNTRGGSFDFSTLHVGDIERIEIVRGPQSAVYGSDALSGAINIITTGGAEQLGAGLHAEVGEYGYRRGALELSGPMSGNGGFALRVATLDDGEPTPGSTYASDSVNAKASFGGGDAWEVRLFGRYSDNEGTSFPEDSGGPELAVLRDLDRKTSEDASVGVAARFALAQGWHFNLTANRYDHDDTFDSPGVASGVRDPVPPNGAASRLGRSAVSAHVVGTLGTSLRGTVGVDYYDEEGHSEGFVEFAPGVLIPSGFSLDRSVTGVFAELRYEPLDPLTLLASLRRDEPNRESGETTAKLGLLYDLGDGRTTLRANWGEGFKLPSFFALGSPLVGNPELRSEKSESVDLGVTQHYLDDALAVTLTAYRNEFTDLIDFDAELFTSVNRSTVIAKGFEVSADYGVTANVDLFAAATYLDLDIVGSDNQLRQRPDWRGSAALRWRASRQWLLDATWYYVGETFDSSIPTGDVTLAGYHRLDATVTFRPTEGLDLLLSVDNLLAESYQEAVGFEAAGRLARLAVRYRF